MSRHRDLSESMAWHMAYYWETGIRVTTKNCSGCCWNAAAVGDSFVLIQDSTGSHTARLVENFFEAETIWHMEWPVCSPDMKLIENVWNTLGRRVAARLRPPVAVQQLKIALRQEWNSIPQSLIDNLKVSMLKKWTKAFARTLFHSDLLLSTILQVFNLETLKSSSTKSAHLNLDLPLVLVPIALELKTLNVKNEGSIWPMWPSNDPS
ncbi:transposable element Tcb2 transposase [Trichonephila clavipes]|nr:transposable element Tcb2 transposase [Trichonephila clavipes]